MSRRIALMFALLLAACATGSAAVVYEDVAVLSSPYGVQIAVPVEIADTPEEWRRGLMDRMRLEGGMLFVFQKEELLKFWMKDTLIPLDVLYFDSGGRLVSVQTMTPCKADPCEKYPSEGPARYALEVPAGYAAEHDVSDGWVLTRENDGASARSRQAGNQR